MFFRVPIVIVALAWPRLALSADTVPCFNPDGSKAEGDIPCFRSSSSLSRVCCSPSQTCSTNGLCVNKASSPPQTFRGSCLDPAFGPSCPTFCTGTNKTQQSAVVSCGDPKAGKFCCDEGKGADCCNTPSKILALGVGNLFPEASGTMGTMPNAPAAQTPQTSVPLQITTLISVQTVTATQIQTSPPLQSSSTRVSSAATTPPAPNLPPIPFSPHQTQREEELARPTGPAGAPFGEARPGVEAALIAEAAVRQPAVASAPPLSAVTIASAAIGGVVIMTLIVVVSVIVMRWRAAKKAEASENKETSSEARPQDEEKGMNMSGGARAPEADRSFVEMRGPNGFAAPDSSTGIIPIMRPTTAAGLENPFQSPLPSPRWLNEERNDYRNSEYSAGGYNETSGPFSGATLRPEPPAIPGNGMKINEAMDSSMKGNYADRQSEWSVATLTPAYPGDSTRTVRTRDVDSLDREVDQMRSRYPEQYSDPNERNYDPSNPRDPPTIETSNGLRIPAAGLERRVSGEGPGNMNSQTFQKLLHDVQSQPF